MTGSDDRPAGDGGAKADARTPAGTGASAFARFFGLAPRPAGAPDPLRDPVFAVLCGYWQGLRDDRPMPLRGQVDPRGLANVLDRVMLLDRIAPGVLRIATAGQRLHGWFGGPPAGLPLSLLFDPESRDALAAMAEGALRRAEPADLRLRAAAGRGFAALAGRPTTEARLLLLPLADAAGRGAGFVAGFAADRGPDRGSRPGFRLVTPMPQAVAARPMPAAPAPAFAENAPGWTPAPPAGARRAPDKPPRRVRLQVIEGDRRD